MLRFACLIVCVGSPALAQCPDGTETLVSCSLRGGAKQLTTCLAGERASYAFGVPGRAPELELNRSVRDVDMRPWPGVGSTIWEEFTFHNKNVSYVVHYSVERTPDGQVGGGVSVMQGERDLVHLSCDPGSVVSAGYGLPLFEAKERAGQTYSLDTQSWN